MEGYCSWCLKRIEAERVVRSRMTRNLYRCPSCGKHIVKCRACRNFACWDSFEIDQAGARRKIAQHDQYCGEHRHVVANFEAVSADLEEPSSYREVFSFRRRNLAKATAVTLTALGGLAVTGPLSYLIGPAVGGAIGTGCLRLSGAAATRAGLALLGGGAIADGGLGIAGGMAVLTIGGSALGGSLGACIGGAYFGQIHDFDIRNVRNGTGPSVITVNGFLSQRKEGHEKWMDAVNRCFPENPWYHVYWESKRNTDLGKLAMGSVLNATVAGAVFRYAKAAGRIAARKLGHAATAGQIIALAHNPWHVAWVKAEKTGVLLADIIQRCRQTSFVLIGFSLGCRVIYAALRSLASTGVKRIESVHLMGGAVGNQAEHWHYACQAVKGKIYNYHSSNDWILKTLYRAGNFFTSRPIGLYPVRIGAVENRDVSRHVSGHMAYRESPPHFMEI